MPRPSWSTAVALPWTSSRAGPTSPPNTDTIAWWPRQTPSTGTEPASARTAASETPAASGRPGPGETTRWEGASRSISSTAISSFLRTTTSTPSTPNRCARLYVNES